MSIQHTFCKIGLVGREDLHRLSEYDELHERCELGKRTLLEAVLYEQYTGTICACARVQRATCKVYDEARIRSAHVVRKEEAVDGYCFAHDAHCLCEEVE